MNHSFSSLLVATLGLQIISRIHLPVATRQDCFMCFLFCWLVGGWWLSFALFETIHLARPTLLYHTREELDSWIFKAVSCVGGISWPFVYFTLFPFCFFVCLVVFSESITNYHLQYLLRVSKGTYLLPKQFCLKEQIKPKGSIPFHSLKLLS